MSAPASEPAPEPTGERDPLRRRRFGPTPTSLFPVAVLLLCTLPLAASSRWLLPLLLLAPACAVWVLRARVVVARAGVEVCNGFGVTRLAWPDVEGLQVPRRGPIRLLRAGSRPLPLTALPRRQVPQFTELAGRLGRASSQPR